MLLRLGTWISEMIEGIIFDWIGVLYQRGKGVLPEASKILQSLKRRHVLGLVTQAQNYVERNAELERSNLHSLFKAVFIDPEKNQDLYRRCIQGLGLTPEKVAIVDDRMVRGIKIGNQLGCTTFWLQKGEYAHELPNTETGDPTYRIHSLDDLLDELT